MPEKSKPQEELKSASKDEKHAAKTIIEPVSDDMIPDEVRDAARHAVAKGREAYVKLTDAAQSGAEDVKEAMSTGYGGAMAISSTIMRNFATNAEAAFGAAQAMAGARSLPEASEIYVRFMRDQMTATSRQAQELFALSANAIKTAMEAAGSATANNLERAQNATE